MKARTLITGRHSRSGVTLLEVSISAMIFVGLFIGLLTFSDTLLKASGSQTSRSWTDKDVGEAISKIVLELSEAEIVYVESLIGADVNGDGDTNDVVRPAGVVNEPPLRTTGSRHISYRVPVDFDNDGDVLDDDGGIEWGGIDPTNGVAYLSPNDGTDPDRLVAGRQFLHTLRFTPSGQVLTENPAAGADYNGDGEFDDTFEAGQIEVIFYGGVGVPQVNATFTDEVILQRRNAEASDLDEKPDAFGVLRDEPLFLQVGDSQIQINILANRRFDGSESLILQRTAVTSRNTLINFD